MKEPTLFWAATLAMVTIFGLAGAAWARMRRRRLADARRRQAEAALILEALKNAAAVPGRTPARSPGAVGDSSPARPAPAAAEPADPSTPPVAPLQAAATAAESAPAPSLVLVADDSKLMRVKTARLLARHAFRVVLAEDGAEAARLLEIEVPLVLITDGEMPGMDGLALTRHVRAHPRARHIAVIMITSADERLREAAAEAGVNAVLGKPYADDSLIACIEQARTQARTQAQTPAEAALSASA